MNAAAVKARLKLLVERKVRNIHDGIRAVRSVIAIAACTGNGTSNEAAVIAPVEPDPRPALPRLILQVRCLVENFVVVDAEYVQCSGSRGGGPNAALLRPKEARRHGREDDER